MESGVCIISANVYLFKLLFFLLSVTMSCFYTLNDTQTIAFFTKPRENEPLPETGFGELQVVLRLAQGMLKML